jgi:hypothetical protein
MASNEKFSDELLDAAACEAIGANTPGESAVYQRELATLDDSARSADRMLRETSARMAAASPHLKPSANLRGRILQATAPATFRMEDYRKANQEDTRYYKWGFYAAAMFLVAASLWNFSYQSALTQANGKIAALGDQNAKLTAAAQEEHDAIATLVNPQSLQIVWKADGKIYGRGVADLATRRAILIFPQEMLASGIKPVLTLQSQGQKVAFQTDLITAPAGPLGLVVPANAPDIAKVLNVQQLTPDKSVTPPAPPSIAGN